MVPLAALFLCLLGYGLLIPQLGFYWDDWAVLWASRASESSGWAGFKDRPLTPWLLSSIASLFDTTPLYWHSLALITRWLGSVALWWTLRGVWPERILQVTCITLLFAVYPGVIIQPISAMTGQQSLISLLLFLISLGGMVWAQRIPRWFTPLTVLALANSMASILLMENTVGLELSRPLLLWLIVSEKMKNVGQRLRFTLKNWSPYLAVLSILAIRRLFLIDVSHSYRDSSAQFRSLISDPLSWVVIRLLKGFSDLVETSLMAWGETFRPDLFRFGSAYALIAWGLVLFSSAVVVLFLLRLQSDSESESQSPSERLSWPKLAVVVGLATIALGILPILFIERHVVLGTLNSRYALPTMFGSCIFLVGLIEWVVRTRLQQVVLLSIVIGFTVGFHFRNADHFRQDWTILKSMLWQLSWRAPGLKPGTLVLIDESPLSITKNDYPLGLPLNFIYSSSSSSGQIDYWVFPLSWKLKSKHMGSTLGGLRTDVALTASGGFSGSTADSLAVWFSPPSCLRVLDPRRDEVPGLSPLARAAQRFSKVDRIRANVRTGVQPLASMFGPEPEHTWCFYFQKADLARQTGDWLRVAQIGDEVRGSGLSPDDSSEWLPFAEAYFNIGRYEVAAEISRLALETSTILQPTLCDFWHRLGEAHPPPSDHFAFSQDMEARISCPSE